MQEHRTGERKKERCIKHHVAMLMPFHFEEPLRPRTNPSSTQKRFSEGTRPRPEHSPHEGDGSGKLLDPRPAEPEWDSDEGAEPERSPSGARTEQRIPKGARDSERTLKSRSGARADPERSTGLRKEHGTPKGRSGPRNYIISRPQNLPSFLEDSMLLKLTLNEEFAEFVNGDLDAVVDKLREVQKDVRKRAR